jgi:uncharacterized cupredoxin-like copper-binding protein
LLALLAPLLILAASVPEQRIDVALSNFKFTPSTIALEHGHAYVLHLSSTGGHSFTAKTFFAAATMSPIERARVAGGKIDLEGCKSADIRFVAPKPGTYRITCTHFLHTSFGMTGTFVVR